MKEFLYFEDTNFLISYKIIEERINHLEKSAYTSQTHNAKQFVQNNKNI